MEVIYSRDIKVKYSDIDVSADIWKERISIYIKNRKIAPSCNSYLYAKYVMYVFHALYFLHCILCTVLYELYSLHFILCIVLYA